MSNLTSVIRVQIDRIAELESQVEALRKDAERYRWLSQYLISDKTNEDDNIISAKSITEIHCVIDAAIAGEAT